MLFRRFVLLPASILALAAPALGDAIQLKASVRLPAGADSVRLADIAVLEGAEAQQYADLVIAEAEAPGELTEISIARVRARLDEAGAHWGRINLSGRKVIVRPRPRAGASSPGAMAAASLTGDSRKAAPNPRRTDERPAAEIIDAATLRGEIARYVDRALGVEPANLRLVFDLADEAWLDRSIHETRFEVKPESSLGSDRVTFTVRAWSDGRVNETRPITVSALIKVATAVLKHDVPRGDVLTAQDFEAGHQWLSPTAAALCCDPSRVAGSMAARKLNAGDVLRERHVEHETLIRRGDRVNVRCLVGGVVISLVAEAREEGGEGETITFRKLGERREFTATVTAAGEAIVDLQRGAMSEKR